MFRIIDVIGLPVTEQGSGRTLCHVRSVLLDSEAGRVLGFILKKSFLKKQMDILMYRQIAALDRNLVQVGFESRHAFEVREEKMDGQVEYENIIDNLVINKNGDVLGMITDLYFNEKTGIIMAYEISEGFIDDVLYGRKLLMPSPEYRLVPNWRFQPDLHARVLYRNVYGKE